MEKCETPNWWHDKTLLVREYRAVSVLAKESWLRDLKFSLTPAGLINLRGTITCYFENYRFELIYPVDYPTGCPEPYPQDRTQRWSKHQWRSGMLCTEYGQDNWSSQFTGADVIRSLYSLLLIEKTPQRGFRPRGPVLSRHASTDMPDLALSRGTFLIPPDLFSKIGGAKNGDFICRLYLDGDRIRVLPFSVTVGGEEMNKWPIPEGLSPTKQFYVEQKGIWFVMPGDVSSHDFARFNSIEDLEQFMRATRLTQSDLACRLKQLAGARSKLPMPVALLKPNSYIVCFLVDTDSNRVHLLKPLSYDPAHADKRRPGSQTLREKLRLARVCIVGLGSLGSKVAVSLARLGVGTFSLIEGEIVEWENVSRHEATGVDVGRGKAEFIRERILEINPDAQVAIEPVQFGSVLAPEIYNRIRGQIENVTLLVDCTADSHVGRLVNNICYLNGVSTLHPQVYAGGVGGQIIRVIPGLTGCLECLSKLLSEFLKNKPEAPHRDAATYEGDPVEQSSPIPGSDDECWLIASMAAKLAKDTIINVDTKSFVVPHHLYLVGFNAGWIFEEPFHVIPIEAWGPDENCFQCGGSQAIVNSLGCSPNEIGEEYSDIISTIKPISQSDNCDSRS